MTTQHTPGPWHANTADRIPSWEGENGIPVYGRLPNGTMPRVANVRSAYGGADADEANARLIAAAPLMLEALEALMTAYATVPGMSGLPMHDSDVWHQARAAIRAATGEDA